MASYGSISWATAAGAKISIGGIARAWRSSENIHAYGHGAHRARGGASAGAQA